MIDPALRRLFPERYPPLGTPAPLDGSLLEIDESVPETAGPTLADVRDTLSLLGRIADLERRLRTIAELTHLDRSPLARTVNAIAREAT